MAAHDQKIQALLAGKERMLIGGDWAQARSRRSFPTHDPATEEKLCDAALAGEEDVESAVQADCCRMSPQVFGNAPSVRTQQGRCEKMNDELCGAYMPWQPMQSAVSN